MSELPAPDVHRAQLGTAFAELARMLVAESAPVDITIPRVVDLSRHAVAGCDHAGLTVLRSFARPETVAATSPIHDRLSALQAEAGEGPSLDVFQSSDVRRINDLSTAGDWPAWSASVIADTPVRSLINVRMVLPSDHRAVFGLYAERANAFDDVDLGVATMFGSYLLRYLYGTVAERKAADLETALDTSRQIGAAMGILMAKELLTFDQAFARLRHASQRLHRKLRDVAAEIVETGVLPEA